MKLLLFLVFSLWPAFSFCSEETAGVTHYAVPGEGACAVLGMSGEECQALALRQARADAIQRAAGLHISSSSLVKDFAVLGDFIKAYTRGFIVGETVMWEPLGQYQKDASTPPIPEYRVHLLADIYVPRKRLTPLGLEGRLNRSLFHDGESMVVEVMTLRPCSVAIFNLSADDRITMLFPNAHEKNSRTGEKGALVFPRKEASPVELLATVLPGHERDVEAVLVVALDPAYPFDFARAYPPLVPMSLTRFFRKFSEIADYCEEVILTYEVTAADR